MCDRVSSISPDRLAEVVDELCTVCSPIEFDSCQVTSFLRRLLEIRLHLVYAVKHWRRFGSESNALAISERQSREERTV